MKEKTGQIFSITKDNPTVAGCTVSKSIYRAKGYDFTYFSLAEYTDISAETYEYPKMDCNYLRQKEDLVKRRLFLYEKYEF
ncbi:hypothetical protein IKE67_03335 [bacterium]|nr:hypothetical protein [bacterium]